MRNIYLFNFVILCNTTKILYLYEIFFMILCKYEFLTCRQCKNSFGFRMDNIYMVGNELLYFIIFFLNFHPIFIKISIKSSHQYFTHFQYFDLSLMAKTYFKLYGYLKA